MTDPSITEAESKLAESQAALAEAKQAESEALSAVGAAIAAGNDPAAAKSKLRQVRDTIEELDAAIPHLKRAVETAKLVVASRAKAERREHLKALAGERIALAKQIDAATSTLLPLLKQSIELSRECVVVARQDIPEREAERLNGQYALGVWIATQLRSILGWEPFEHRQPSTSAAVALVEQDLLAEVL